MSETANKRNNPVKADSLRPVRKGHPSYIKKFQRETREKGKHKKSAVASPKQNQ